MKNFENSAPATHVVGVFNRSSASVNKTNPVVGTCKHFTVDIFMPLTFPN